MIAATSVGPTTKYVTCLSANDEIYSWRASLLSCFTPRMLVAA